MSNLAAVIAGLALASILVAAVSVRRDEARPAKPLTFEARQVDMPVPTKADRLPLPAIPEPDPFPFFKGVYAQPMQLKADPVVPARAGIAVAHLKLPADPVCGPRGRTWYTKDNGYRYWRCVR